MSNSNDAETAAPKFGGAIQRIIEPEPTDLGEFSVRRALPHVQQTMVGPFIFFDHIGPAEFPAGKGIQVRPHPHIGLATLTYLFEGEIIHRDSLGFTQAIHPGAVNLMTAGRGIVHSERSRKGNAAPSRLHGIQCWMALPDAEQECEPDFVHYDAGSLPEFVSHGARIRVVVGSAYGHTSPVAVRSKMLYLECRLCADAELELPQSVAEMATYVVSGTVTVDGQALSAGRMAVLRAATPVVLRAREDCRVVVIGGEPVGQRHIWWNFVSNSRTRIEQAKDDWRQGRFGRVPGDNEFIPLPEN